MTIKNRLPQLKPSLSETQIFGIISRHVDALGERALPYGREQSVEELRAYFRLFLEPYLRDLKGKSVIKDFFIGISRCPAFFFKPQLKLIMKSGAERRLALNRFILGGNKTTGRPLRTPGGLILPSKGAL